MSKITSSAARKNAVLRALANFSQTTNDSRKGRYSLDGATLLKQTKLTVDEINDAVELLSDDGLVSLYKVLGTHPFEFKNVELTPQGREYLEAIEDQSDSPTPMETTAMQRDPQKVFVVHGRDEGARNALFSFLRSIDIKPIEFTQALANTKSAAPFIGQALETAFEQATAVIVLLTGDDEARLRTELNNGVEAQWERQARPNVLFEAGMAMASHRDRTVLVEVGTLRAFSDVSGRHVVRLTDGNAAERMDIINRLKAAGCKIELEGKSDFLKVDFFEVLKNPR